MLECVAPVFLNANLLSIASAVIPTAPNAVLISLTVEARLVPDSTTVTLRPSADPIVIVLLAVNVGVPAVPVTEGQLPFQFALPTSTHAPVVFLYHVRIIVETATTA